MFRLMTSAERRLAAISKVVRVRWSSRRTVEDRLAAQQGDFLDVPVGHADELVGGIEDMGDDVARQALDGQEVLEFAVARELGIAFKKALSEGLRGLRASARGWLGSGAHSGSCLDDGGEDGLCCGQAPESRRGASAVIRHAHDPHAGARGTARAGTRGSMGHAPLASVLKVKTRGGAGYVALEYERRVLGHGNDDRTGEAGGKREFAATPVDEHGELDRGRTAEIVEFVERRAHGAAGVEHVVDKHHAPPFDGERQGGRRGLAVQAFLRVVVAVQRDVDDAELARAKLGREAFGEPGAAGMDAGEHGGRQAGSSRGRRRESGRAGPHRGLRRRNGVMFRRNTVEG